MSLRKKTQQRVPKKDFAALRREINKERQRFKTVKIEVEELDEEIKDALLLDTDRAPQDVEDTGADQQPAQHNSSENDGNEYKKRFENQADVNRGLMREIETLKKRLDKEKKSFKKGKSSVADDESEYYGAKGKKLLIRLQREKVDLESHIRDYEWKLDQEARTYHKVNERCAQMVRDIQRVSGNVTGGDPKQPQQTVVDGKKSNKGKRRESKGLESIPEMMPGNRGGRRRSSVVGTIDKK